MLNAFINNLLFYFNQLGYGGIFVLMTLESTFLLVPSELVIPPAAYLASRGEMNIFFVIAAGTIGSLMGALINYFLGRQLGKPIIYAIVRHRHAKWIFLSEKKMDKAEKYFLKYGNISTFIGRLVPGVRHLISIPAGMSNMNLKDFILYTVLGAGIWTTILAILGYVFGANQDILMAYYKEITAAFIIVGVVATLVILFLIFRKNRGKKSDQTN